MSELQQETEDESSTSAEEKFFGVRTQIGKKLNEVETTSESEASDFEYEIVDDRPKEDRRPAKTQSLSEEDDEELSGYSEKVQKRINKLRYEQNEERRQREASERMRDEAVLVAQQLAGKNKEYEALIIRGEGALINQVKQKAEMALENARAKYKKAYEEGDTDNVVSGQEDLMKAQSELTEAQRYENNLPSEEQWQPPPPNYQQPPVAPVQQQQQVAAPQPSPESAMWAQKNPWFMSQDYKAMTATAYGLHEEAVRDHGLMPNSQQYFNHIDVSMRQSYPNFDWQDKSDINGRSAPVTVNQPPSVVAPSTRNNGSKPRKVQLTSTQVALAKRLGLTNEQYAKELIKGRF